jgi:hypothetical protein
MLYLLPAIWQCAFRMPASKEYAPVVAEKVDTGNTTMPKSAQKADLTPNSNRTS